MCVFCVTGLMGSQLTLMIVAGIVCLKTLLADGAAARFLVNVQALSAGKYPHTHVAIFRLSNTGGYKVHYHMSTLGNWIA